MSLTALALRRPVTTVMTFVCCILLGGVSAWMLPLEKFPDVEFPGMFIELPYPGSTPEEVERLITRPAEEVIGTIGGIERMQSESDENGARIFLEFNWGEDVSIKGVEVREKLDGIRDELPADFERYVVRMFSTADMELLQFRISSRRDLSDSYDMLNRSLLRRIERLEGVGKVELYGVNRKEIRVELLADRVAAHNVDVNALQTALRGANFSVTAGRVTDSGRRFAVRPVGEVRSPEEIGDLIVGPNYLRLRDVATVTYGQPELEFGRHLNGTYAVGLDVFKASGYNTVEVANRVKAEIDAIGNDPDMAGINLLTFEDQAESVVTSLIELLKAGLLGAVLAFFVLFFFLRQISTTLIVSLAVPISILITLVFLYFFGISLNVLSLMGLLLAVGMLVDNAVVITESIHQRQLRRPGDVREATVRGVKDVAMAVTAGTLTTAIVFLPAIVSPKDQISLFLKHVAIAISIALAASLLMSQTIIPLLTSRLKPPKPRKTAVDRLVGGYGRFLRWTLRRRAISALGVLAILFSVMIPGSFVENDMFPEEGQRRIWIQYRVNGNYTLERVEAAVSEFENYLLANKEAFEIEHVYSYYGGTFASTSIYLIDEERSTKSRDEIREAIRANMPRSAVATARFESDRGGFGGAAEAVRISLRGESTQRLVDLSREVERMLARVDGFADVRSEAEADKEEIHVVVDRLRARQAGFSAESVARSVATAMRGQNLPKIRGEDGEIDVRMEFQDADRQTMEDLRNLPLVTPSGERIALAALADIQPRKGPQTIRRRDRSTILSISVDLEQGVTLEEASQRLSAAMAGVSLPAGYSWGFGERFDREQETQQTMLVNLLLALVLIYLVMAALFESLLTPAAIWTSILFAVVGVFWFFLLTGTTFSLMAMIGILVLVGIVVNNGIVLLDHVLKLRSEGLSRTDAIVEGGKERLRPILMTAGTTILGLLPLCFGGAQIGGDGPPYYPMARAIVGGLAFSTGITLVVLPTIYVWLDDLRNWSRRIARLARSA